MEPRSTVCGTPSRLPFVLSLIAVGVAAIFVVGGWNLLPVTAPLESAVASSSSPLETVVPGGALPAGYFWTPFGTAIPSSCLTVIPSGSSLQGGSYLAPDGSTGALPSCPDVIHAATPPPATAASSALSPSYRGNGWIVAANDYYAPASPPSIAYLSASWTVPKAPSDQSNQYFYIFDDLQYTPSDAINIIQPVLQWGHTSETGGGNYYGLAEWMVWSNSYAVTSLQRVYPGDTIVGTLQGTSCNAHADCDFKVTGQDTTKGHTSTQSLACSGGSKDSSHLCGLGDYWANEVLEAYSITSCSEYPASGSTTFSNTLLKSSGGASILGEWTSWVITSGCGASESSHETGTYTWSNTLHY